MAEVVRGELQLEAVDGRPPLRQGHDAGVVDQQVDRPATCTAPDSELGDRRQIRQIEGLAHYGGAGCRSSDLGCCGFAFGLASGGEHHIGPSDSQRPRRLIADAAVGSGHDRQSSSEVGDVFGGPGLAAHGCSCLWVPVAGTTLRQQRSLNKRTEVLYFAILGGDDGARLPPRPTP
jgi:hypothetical protein